MNEPTDTTISLSELPTLSVVGSYDDDGPIWSSVETNSVSGFPWTYILKSPACTLDVSTTISVFGISSVTKEEKVTLLTDDELGLKATESSQPVVNISRYAAAQTSYVMLPESLKWLYGDKPYIGQTYLAAIYTDLVKALEDGEASDSLYRYVRSHTLKTMMTDVVYRSFGDYVDKYGLLDVKPSYVRIRLGTSTTREDVFINSSLVDDIVTLSHNTATELHLIVQRRIGVATAVYDTTVFVETPATRLHLGYTDGGDLYDDMEIDDSSDVTITLTKLFSIEERIPVVCNPGYITVSRKVPMNILTGVDRVPGLPPLILRTINGEWANDESRACDGETSIYLDQSYITTDPMYGTVYISYLTSEY